VRFCFLLFRFRFVVSSGNQAKPRIYFFPLNNYITVRHKAASTGPLKFSLSIPPSHWSQLQDQQEQRRQQEQQLQDQQEPLELGVQAAEGSTHQVLLGLASQDLASDKFVQAEDDATSAATLVTACSEDLQPVAEAPMSTVEAVSSSCNTESLLAEEEEVFISPAPSSTTAIPLSTDAAAFDDGIKF
jgi:hypothetical protein